MKNLAQTADNWQKLVKPYAQADHKKSWWQFLSTLMGFALTWFLAYQSLRVSYWLTLLFCLFSTVFSVRLFIIFHDCGHGNYFKSKRLRTIIGYLCGILVLTPYWQWTKSHGIHHATSGNLDKRGIGDMLTYSIKEYEKLNWFHKLYYHCYRHPFMTFFLGPLMIFTIEYRFTAKIDGARERKSVYLTNLALLGILTLCYFTIGLKNFFLVQAPISIVACSVGSWLFYVQHQYAHPYWEKEENWSFFDAALKGSSYYKLPRILQYASGNIGLHHLHHLSHAIPNYNLEKCMNDNELFQTPITLTLKESFHCAFLNIYDEESQSLISFKEYRAQKKCQQKIRQQRGKELYTAQDFISDC